MSVTRKGQVPSRTSVPGTLPKTESKEAGRPAPVAQGPSGTRVSPPGPKWGGVTCQGSPGDYSEGLTVDVTGECPEQTPGGGAPRPERLTIHLPGTPGEQGPQEPGSSRATVDLDGRSSLRNKSYGGDFQLQRHKISVAQNKQRAHRRRWPAWV